jgi:1,4-dihydroxy-2-naphthoyl-CoA hydrolase
MINTEIVTIEKLNLRGKNTMVEHLGIEVTGLGENFLEGKMPVDHRTKQPEGLLHGGASAVLSETLGSIAANCCVDNSKQYCVGLEINANHIRGVKDGYVYGRAEAVHIGRKTQVWETKIYNEDKKLVCVSRLTLSVVDR